MLSTRNLALFLSTILLSGIISAAETITSSYIEDLPALKASADDADLLEWTKPGVKRSDYTKLMVTQPLILLAEENKYRGLQPDHMKLLADRVAVIFVSKLGNAMEIVDRPGPGVIVLNMAVTELKMKKKRGLLSFTPIGAVAHAATSQTEYEDLQQLTEKVLMADAKLEVEMVDGSSGERVAVRILQITSKEKGREETSWEALALELRSLADRFYTNYQASFAR